MNHMIENCRHCHLPVEGSQGAGYYHPHTNMGRCDPAESGLPYGRNAQPEGTDCEPPCIDAI